MSEPEPCRPKAGGSVSVVHALAASQGAVTAASPIQTCSDVEIMTGLPTRKGIAPTSTRKVGLQLTATPSRVVTPRSDARRGELRGASGKVR